MGTGHIYRRLMYANLAWVAVFFFFTPDDNALYIVMASTVLGPLAVAWAEWRVRRRVWRAPPVGPALELGAMWREQQEWAKKVAAIAAVPLPIERTPLRDIPLENIQIDEGTGVVHYRPMPDPDWQSLFFPKAVDLVGRQGFGPVTYTEPVDEELANGDDNV